jgi:hypothetical protein
MKKVTMVKDLSHRPSYLERHHDIQTRYTDEHGGMYGIGTADSGPSQKGYSGGYIHWSAFLKAIENLCRRYNIPDSREYVCEQYWPAFSRLDDAGQHAFWQVLGGPEDNGKETLHAVCDD